MKISANLIKELRDKTSAGILDCKKALAASNGDIQKSINWLREKGIANANKKSDRVASEGIVNIVSKKNIVVIYEVNSETDFVAKNKKFLDLIDTISEAFLSNPEVKTVDEVLEITIKNRKLKDIIIENISVIGEKITLRRFNVIKLDSNQSFGSYIHNQRTAALVIFNGKCKDSVISKQVAMHVTAMSPKFISRKDIPTEFMDSEKQILTKKALSEGKPKNIVEKMVIGRLKKSLSEICLLDQNFVVDPTITISKLLTNNSLDIVNMIRFEVGEGIEKVVEDFATEVKKQIKK